MSIVTNPIESITKANYIGILVWAVLFGISFRHSKDSTKQIFNDIANGLSKVVSWIILFAPLGILGLVFNAVSTSGMKIFTQYGKLILLLVGCMLFQEFITNGIIVDFALRKIHIH